MVLSVPSGFCVIYLSIIYYYNAPLRGGEGEVGLSTEPFFYFLVFVRLWELAHDNITKIKRNNKLYIIREICGICERPKFHSI